MFVASVGSGLMNCSPIAPRVSAEKSISLSQAVERTEEWTGLSSGHMMLNVCGM